MKIKSFGDSFIYGSDLRDRVENPMIEYSELTWPAILSKKLNVTYECYAQPGQGNFKIFCDILSEIEKDCVYVIGWTWIDRFDYVDAREKWQTLRPGGEDNITDFYYRNLHSQISDMIKTAAYINSAIELLNTYQLPFLMTYMDDLIFDSIDPNWQNPRYLLNLQNRIRPFLKNYDGQNFLDWSRSRNFSVSDYWHPLEDAHQAAAEFWSPTVSQLILNSSTKPR